jgi:hypothetical protein
MRVLLSRCGSRADIEPMVELAMGKSPATKDSERGGE